MVEASKEFIDQDMAESVLLRFGIKKSSSAYDRWLIDGGFYLKDFDEVLFESPHIIVFDWRTSTDQIGLQLKRVFQYCKVKLDWNMVSPNRGQITANGKQIDVSYDPSKGDQIAYFVGQLLMQLELETETVKIFAGNDNGMGDSAVFAILKSNDADRLSANNPLVMTYYFNDLKDSLRETDTAKSKSIFNMLKKFFSPKR